MSTYQFTPETVRLAEILTFQGAPAALMSMIGSLDQAAHWAKILVEYPEEKIAKAAGARAALYTATAEKVQRLFEDLEVEIRNLRVTEGPAAEPESPGVLGKVVEPGNVPIGSRAAVLAALATLRGDDKIVMICPVCGTGRHVADDGKCAACGGFAVDTRAGGAVPFYCDVCKSAFAAVAPESTATNQDVACPRCHTVETHEGHEPMPRGNVVRIEKRR